MLAPCCSAFASGCPPSLERVADRTVAAASGWRASSAAAAAGEMRRPGAGAAVRPRRAPRGWCRMRAG